jgi:hypothetical protein
MCDEARMSTFIDGVVAEAKVRTIAITGLTNLGAHQRGPNSHRLYQVVGSNR